MNANKSVYETFVGGIRPVIVLLFIWLIPGLLGVFGLIDLLKGYLTASVVDSSSPQAYSFNAGKYLFDSDFIWIIPLFVSLLCYAIFVSARLFNKVKFLKSEISALEYEINGVNFQKKLNGFYSDIERICNKMIYEEFDENNDGINNTIYNYDDINLTYRIHKNGEVLADHRFEVVAENGDVYFWKYRITSDQSNEGVDDIESLNLEVTTASSGREVAFIPIRDDKYYKEIVVFFFLFSKKAIVLK